MDDDIIAAFLSWVDDNEENIDYTIAFDSCDNSVLRFTISEQSVKIDFMNKTANSSSKDNTIRKFVTYIMEKLKNHGDLDYPEFLADIFNHYSDLKAYSSEEEEGSSDENYHEVIKEAIYKERLEQAHVTGEAIPQSALGFYSAHFVYKEAEEAVALLNTTLLRCPKLKYSINIRNNKAFCNVRLEIDLSFLEIPDSVMVMLGLDYENPLVVSCSISDIRLSQTVNVDEWTPALLGFLDFTVLQAGSSDSYGCNEYILGRVKKFRELIYKQVTNKTEPSSFLTLSRENSEDASFKNASSQLTKKLISMGYKKVLVKQAVQLSKNNEDLALEYLNNETEGKYTGEFSNEIIVCNNFFYNLLFYLRDRIQNCTNYCYICYQRHIVESYRLRPCSAEICEFRFEEISGISIYAEICSNPNLVHMDLSLAAESATSNRSSTVFEPFPSFLLKKNQIRGKSGFFSGDYSTEMDSNKDIQSLRGLIIQMPDINSIKSYSTDEVTCRDYISSISADGHLIYKLMRYIIATNRLNFIKLDEDNLIKKIGNGIEQYIVMNHPPETEKEFANKKKAHGSFFAFHGSAVENWYSILRNGIRNLSNTHMMTAGAAYGAGVYSAENIATSFGYCRFNGKSCQWPHSAMSNPEKCCMAIIEVIKADKYTKNSGIYVITNDKDLIIRYLLVFPGNAMGINVNVSDLGLDKHYTSTKDLYLKKETGYRVQRIERAIKKAREQEEAVKKSNSVEEVKLSPAAEAKIKTVEDKFSGKGSSMTNKRIMQEYKYLISSKECKGLTAEFEGEINMYVWIVKVDINAFEVTKQLKEDFKQYSNRYNRPMEMIFEVRFDSNYPYNPPFLRLIRPRFAFRTGHITVGGSICMQSITRSGWIPVRTIESIFIEILFNMAEGGARLDLNSSSVDYSLSEAQDAFNRVARDHNWL